MLILLEEFPTEETRQLVLGFLDRSEIWYYHRMGLQAYFARAFPRDSASREIVKRSLEELDGPDFGEFAVAFEGDAEVSALLLGAAVTAPVDVRMAVATTLRLRSARYGAAVELTGDCLAEEVGEVRTSCVLARAQAARGESDSTAAMSAFLKPEVDAAGMYGFSRRLSGAAGLIALGETDAVEEMLRESFGAYEAALADFRRDAVGVGVLLENWKAISSGREMPMARLVQHGYAELVERSEAGRAALDGYLMERLREAESLEWSETEVAARRVVGRDLVCAHLLELLTLGRRGVDVACGAARLLRGAVGGDRDMEREVSRHVGPLEDRGRGVARGVLGYLVLGWPEGDVARWAQGRWNSGRMEVSARDRLLMAVAFEDWSAGEDAARELLGDVAVPWRYRIEDAHALRVWSGARGAADALKGWVDEDDASYSLTALSLAGSENVNFEVNVGEVINRFNAELAAVDRAPRDGVDAATGEHRSWAAGAYSSMVARWSV